MAVTPLFVFLTVAGLVTGRFFHLHNILEYTVWTGIQGNDDMEHPGNGGFTMFPSDSINLQVPDNWGGRIWARTGCKFDISGQIQCATGDCGVSLECNGTAGEPPATFFQIHLNLINGMDFYNISLVDGFNVPMRVIPNIGSEGGYWCTNAYCLVDLNLECPDDLQVKDGEIVVACKSSCLEYDTDETCCRGEFSDLESCKNSTSAVYFKSNCPDAYSYPYDDATSTFACSLVDYDIVFG